MERLLLEGLLLALLIALSAFFSGTELAFLSLSRVRMQALLEKKAKNAGRVAWLREHRRKVIISLLIGNNIANIAASALATSISIGLFGQSGLGIAIGAMTFLVLTFGEIVPKSYASGHGESIILTVSPVIEVFYAITYPLVLAFELINRVVPGAYSLATNVEMFTEDEVRSAVKLGAKSKGITEKERELMENVLAFNDKPVSQAMTPKASVEWLDASLTVQEAYQKAVKSNYSRFPVLKEGRPIGVTGLKTLSRAALADPGKHLSDLSMPKVFVKLSDKANVVFYQLQGMGRNVAIVVDDKENFMGVVTLEDLLEELVGEIS